MESHFGCLEEVSKSVQVLFNCTEAVMVLTLILLNYRALLMGGEFSSQNSSHCGT